MQKCKRTWKLLHSEELCTYIYIYIDRDYLQKKDVLLKKGPLGMYFLKRGSSLKQGTNNIMAILGTGIVIPRAISPCPTDRLRDTSG